MRIGGRNAARGGAARGGLLALAAILAVSSALAQAPPDAGGSPPAPSAEAQKAAAALFQKGEAAFRAQDFRTAAESFDAAYDTAPHPSPLWNAARAWHQAGEHARAANRYEAYLQASAADAADRPKAEAELEALRSELGVLAIRPAELTDIAVDGEPVDHPAHHYVTPGDHRVTGRLAGRPLEAPVTAKAGESSTVVLGDAPPPVVGTVAPPVPGPAPAPSPAGASAPVESTSSGWPAWIALTAGGLTVLAGGHIVWSGIDTLNAREDFDAEPTTAALEDGQRRQARTNFIITTTAVLGAFTVVALALTDWGGEGEAPGPQVGVGPGSLVLSGSF